MGTVRDRFGGLGRFKGELSVIINLITDITTNYNKYKYNVKRCMYTISALYQIINLNVSA